LLVLHPIALGLLSFNLGFSGLAAAWLGELEIVFGVIALVGLVGIIIWTVSAQVKYETFVLIHQLLGLMFVFGAVHAFMAGSILAANSFMYGYLLVLSVAGGLTYIVYSLLGDALHRPYKYRLSELTRYSGNVIELELSPVSRILNFVPGQFVYVRFRDLPEHGQHPFSISSGRRSGELKLVVREAGDFTESLKHLKVGAVVDVSGPHGGFLLQLNRQRKQLWIAGGIGVTPFLSGAASLASAPSRRGGGDIEMIYSTAEVEPYGLQHLQDIEDRNDIFNVTHLHADEFGYVSFDTLAKNISDIEERDIYICGPPPMLQALRNEAQRLGLDGNLRFEEFEY